MTFDHRGHGASGHPTDPAAYSLARMRADTWAVADAVGLDRFRVLGHSMGGMVVRRMPLEQPERIDALVLMDTSAGPIPTLVPELVEIGGLRRAHRRQGRAQGAARLGRHARHATPISACSSTGPATASSRTASGPTRRW